jgi:hypothetical protein
MNWYIGQKVTCVSAMAPTGGVLHVHEVFICSQCKLAHLTISEWPKKPNGIFECTDCDGIFFNHHRIGGSERVFRPLLDTFAEETLSKAKSDADEILEIMETLHPVEKSFTGHKD